MMPVLAATGVTKAIPTPAVAIVPAAPGSGDVALTVLVSAPPTRLVIWYQKPAPEFAAESHTKSFARPPRRIQFTPPATLLVAAVAIWTVLPIAASFTNQTF